MPAGCRRCWMSSSTRPTRAAPIRSERPSRVPAVVTRCESAESCRIDAWSTLWSGSDCRALVRGVALTADLKLPAVQRIELVLVTADVPQLPAGQQSTVGSVGDQRDPAGVGARRDESQLDLGRIADRAVKRDRSAGGAERGRRTGNKRIAVHINQNPLDPIRIVEIDKEILAGRRPVFVVRAMADVRRAIEVAAPIALHLDHAAIAVCQLIKAP